MPDQVELHGEGSDLVCFTGILEPVLVAEDDELSLHSMHAMNQRAGLVCEGRAVVRGVRVAPHMPLQSPLGSKPSPGMCAAVILNAPPEHQQGQQVRRRNAGRSVLELKGVRKRNELMSVHR